MLTFILIILGMAFATEAIVELVIKSSIFSPIRRLISKFGSRTAELFKCGYCFSVWTAMVMVSIIPVVVLPVTDWFIINAALTMLVVHRLSNVIHNVIDKWTDKYYDHRYVNTDKN